mmetsp:Transcript_12177/g.18293  ORF Transcript_12177/g.18293 Transcript_12177/m.18293 type:complete len:219 (+) Transcript_12177:144-800(+)
MVTATTIQRIASTTALSIPFAICFHDCFYSISRIEGRSMDPLLQQGDYILTKRFDLDIGILQHVLSSSINDNGSEESFDPCYQSSFFCFNFPPRISKGDIAVFKSPIDFPAKLCVKRVICEALPSNKGGGAIVNQYNYLSRTRRRTVQQRPSAGFMPPCTVWMEGDNRKWSDDSNHFGPVSKKLLVGRVVRIIWPPSRWARINSEESSSSSSNSKHAD